MITLTSIISLIGSAGIRMLWGEISSWITKHQDHKQEMDRIREQRLSDAQIHSQNLERMKLANTLELKTIEINGALVQDMQEGKTFDLGVETLAKPTGYAFIDIWKSAIVPLLATLCVFLIFMHSYQTDFAWDDYTKELVGSVIGLFIADRFLFRRGK